MATPTDEKRPRGNDRELGVGSELGEKRAMDFMGRKCILNNRLHKC